MNPLTNVKNITKLNEVELQRGLTNKSSWHNMYKDSAWIFIGGLAYGMTEGDVIAVFSQYGEIVNINMIRDPKTGKIKGFCFLCYANQKSTTLAVDNFNGIKLCGRTIRVDHVANYKVPKEHENDDEMTRALMDEGCAPKLIKEPSPEPEQPVQIKKPKVKKEKVKKRRRKVSSSSSSSSSSSGSSSSTTSHESEVPQRKTYIKKEKHDPGYDKYMLTDEPGCSNSHKTERRSEKRKHKSTHSIKQSHRITQHSDESYQPRKSASSSSKHQKRSESEESDYSRSSKGKNVGKKNNKYESQYTAATIPYEPFRKSEQHQKHALDRRKDDSESSKSTEARHSSKHKHRSEKSIPKHYSERSETRDRHEKYDDNYRKSTDESYRNKSDDSGRHKSHSSKHSKSRHY